MKVLLISDTHGWLDDAIRKEMAMADEVWHAGDIGPGILEELTSHPGFRGVWGNIDGREVRSVLSETLVFEVDGLKVFMQHIVGAPGKYLPETKKLLRLHQPKLIVAGHSHILHVKYYETFNVLHFNPGASGHHGFHTVRTAIKFNIQGGKPVEAAVIEWGRRGRIQE